MHDLIIADRQDITKAGLLFLSSKLGGFHTISEARNKEELIRQLEAEPRSVVILDYTLFDFVGIDELLEIKDRFRNARWILFSDHLSEEILNKLIFHSHAFSVVLKSCSHEEITRAIHCSSCGERFICNRISNQLLTSIRPAWSSPPVHLSPTEKEILKAIASGMSTKAIAAERHLSIHTVLTHRKNIFRKAGVKNLQQAIAYALRSGIVERLS